MRQPERRRLHPRSDGDGYGDPLVFEVSTDSCERIAKLVYLSAADPEELVVELLGADTREATSS